MSNANQQPGDRNASDSVPPPLPATEPGQEARSEGSGQPTEKKRGWLIGVSVLIVVVIAFFTGKHFYDRDRTDKWFEAFLTRGHIVNSISASTHVVSGNRDEVVFQFKGFTHFGTNIEVEEISPELQLEVFYSTGRSVQLRMYWVRWKKGETRTAVIMPSPGGKIQTVKAVMKLEGQEDLEFAFTWEGGKKSN